MIRKNNFKDFSYYIDLYGYVCLGYSEGVCVE